MQDLAKYDRNETHISKLIFIYLFLKRFIFTKLKISSNYFVLQP